MKVVICVTVAVLMLLLGRSRNAEAQSCSNNSTGSGSGAACYAETNTYSGANYSFGLYGEDDSAPGVGVMGVSTGGYGMMAQSETFALNAQIVPANTTGTAILAAGGAIGISAGGSEHGVQALSQNGNGVWAQSGLSGTGSDAVYGDAEGTQGAGLHGYGATTANIGVLGQANTSTAPGFVAGVVGMGSGSGVYGGYFTSNNAEALFATSDANEAILGVYSSTTGVENGVKGTSASSNTSSAGVYGENTGAGYGVHGSTTGTASTSYGVYASANGGDSFAVYGDALSTTQGTGVSGHGGTGVSGFGGVFGVWGSGAGDDSYGVYGECSGTGCWSMYGAGKMGNYNGTFSSSDIRLKKDVKPLDGAVDQLLQLHGVTFEWKNPTERGEGLQRGFIAQDVEKVFPNWVTTDPTGFKAVNTRGIEALLVESVRTQKAQIEQLKEQVRTLENGGHPVVGAMGAFGGIGAGNLIVSLLGVVGAFAVSRRKKAEGTS